MRTLVLALLCLLSSMAVAKDDPPVPALPLPAGTPGAMVMVWKDRFVFKSTAYKVNWLRGERLMPDDKLPPPVPADDPRLMSSPKP